MSRRQVEGRKFSSHFCFYPDTLFEHEAFSMLGGGLACAVRIDEVEDLLLELWPEQSIEASHICK